MNNKQLSEFKNSILRLGQSIKQELHISQNYTVDEEFNTLQRQLHAVETRGYKLSTYLDDFLTHLNRMSNSLASICTDFEKECQNIEPVATSKWSENEHVNFSSTVRVSPKF
jgi:predicted  nucleic acid-binding Zn-ribbon protein